MARVICRDQGEKVCQGLCVGIRVGCPVKDYV